MEHRLEARFDKFMGYYYPCLKDISNAASIYKRMQLSLMYDYRMNHKGRYIYETVPYIDGGSFSMRDLDKVRQHLSTAGLLHSGRSYGPIESTPPSRIKERIACDKVLFTTNEMLSVDIYDENIDMPETVERIHDVLDSLNIEIQMAFLKLKKYRNANSKISINSIREYDYDINNY